jgi:hypothetical protein
MNDWWVDVPEARVLPAARREAERAQLVALAAQPVGSRTSRPLVLAAGGFALVAATGAGFAIFGSGQASDRSHVECHTTVEAARGVAFAGTDVALVSPIELGSGRALIADAVGKCAELWQQGVLQPGAPNAQGPTGHIEQVPPLTACLTEDGVAAVFPTAREICEGLGLQRLGQ